MKTPYRTSFLVSGSICKRLVFGLAALYCMAPLTALGAISFNDFALVDDGYVDSADLDILVTGPNAFLACDVFEQNASGDDITSVVASGTPMVRTSTDGYNAFNFLGVTVNWYQYILTNPAPGINNIVTTFGSPQYFQTHCASYSGVDQTNPIATTTKEYLEATNSFSLDYTNIELGDWLVSGIRSENAGNIINGTNAILRSPGPTSVGFLDSSGLAGSGTVSASITTGGSPNRIFGVGYALRTTSFLKAIQPVSTSTVTTNLQDNPALTLILSPHKTYILDGLLIATSTSSTPDLVIAINTSEPVVMNVGYTAVSNSSFNGGVLVESGSASPAITLEDNSPKPISLSGAVTTGNATTSLAIQWAQETISTSSPVTISAGSYLQATEF